MSLTDSESRSGSGQQKKKSLDHAAVVQWRAILDRLRSFLRYIDYLILELSRRIVIVALRLLLAEFITCANVDSHQKEWALKYLSEMRKKIKWRSRYIKNENDLLIGSEKSVVIDDGVKALFKLDLTVVLPDKEDPNATTTSTTTRADEKRKSIEMSYNQRKSLEFSQRKRPSVEYLQYRKKHSNKRTSIEMSTNKRTSIDLNPRSGKRTSIEANRFQRGSMQLPKSQKRSSIESLQGNKINRLNAPRKSIIVGVNDQHKGRKKSVAFNAAPVTYQYHHQLNLEPLVIDQLLEDEEDVVNVSKLSG